MSLKKTAAHFFPNLLIAAGMAGVSMAVLTPFILAGILPRSFGVICIPVVTAVFIFKMFNRSIESALLESLYPVYRYPLKAVAAAMVFAAVHAVVGSTTGAFCIFQILLWLGSHSRSAIAWKLPVAGVLFLVGLSAAGLPFNVRMLILFLPFAGSALLLLYGIQFSEHKEITAATAFCDIMESGLLILGFTGIPAIAAFAVTRPLAGDLALIRQGFDEFAEAASEVEPAAFDYSLLLDSGILVVMLAVLIVLWRKFAGRDRESQKKIDETAYEVFGRGRRLDLEEKKKRAFPPGYRGRIIRLYFRFIDRLEIIRILKPAYHTPEEFAEGLTAGDAVRPEDIAVFTRLFVTARFSDRIMTADDYKEARLRYEALQKTIAVTR